MTVLQRKEARGFNTGGARKYVIGLVMAVVGVGAAYGISQLIDNDGGSTVHEVLAERGAAAGEYVESLTNTGLAQQQAMREAAEVQTRTTTGLVQGELIRGAGQDAAAQRASFESALGSTAAAETVTGWTLEDELNAIHQEGDAIQPTAQTQPQGWTHEQIAEFHAINDFVPAAQTSGLEWTMEEELAAIHARTGVEQASGQSQTGQYAQQPAGPR